VAAPIAVANKKMNTLNTKKYETTLIVRPDDIDMNNHVHSSKYMDYVLFARFDQMEKYYKMGIQEFIEKGYNWVIKSTEMEFKRSLILGETCQIITWLDSMAGNSCKVCFEIKKMNGKESCSGHFIYTLINLKTGKSENVPEWIVERYSI
jgi:acyl-CoA thioester hydrolase/thioesterase-3